MIKYKILQKIVKIATKIYVRPTYEGLENVPKDGPYIFAGNHLHLVDPGVLMSITNKPIHFLAKSSLFKFPQSIIFNNMGLIVVNRDGKDTSAYQQAVKYLKNGDIVGIYPEGTRERGRGLLPFKTGAVRMSLDANVPIIPFAVVGMYKPFRKSVIVKFGKPYKATKDIERSNEKLREIIKNLLEKK